MIFDNLKICWPIDLQWMRDTVAERQSDGPKDSVLVITRPEINFFCVWHDCSLWLNSLFLSARNARATLHSHVSSRLRCSKWTPPACALQIWISAACQLPQPRPRFPVVKTNNVPKSNMADRVYISCLKILIKCFGINPLRCYEACKMTGLRWLL